jgi:hypothetical protein
MLELTPMHMHYAMYHHCHTFESTSANPAVSCAIHRVFATTALWYWLSVRFESLAQVVPVVGLVVVTVVFVRCMHWTAMMHSLSVPILEYMLSLLLTYFECMLDDVVD